MARFGVRRRLLTPLECDVFAVLPKLWSMSTMRMRKTNSKRVGQVEILDGAGMLRLLRRKSRTPAARRNGQQKPVLIHRPSIMF